MTPNRSSTEGVRYSCSRRNRYRIRSTRWRCVGDLGSDSVAVERTSLVRYSPSRTEVSAHLESEANVGSDKPSPVLGLVDREQTQGEGKTEPLSSDLGGGNYPIRLPFAYRRRRYSRGFLRIGVIDLRAQRIGRIGVVPTNAVSLARKVRPLRPLGKYALRLSAFVRRLRLGTVGL